MKAAVVPLTSRQFGWTVACIAVTVIAHVSHLPAVETAFLGAILLVAWWGRRRPQPVSAWIKAPLMLLLVALVVMRYGTILGREPGTALACGMLGLKLLETRSRRDTRSIVSFSSFMLMAALMFAGDLFFSVFAALSTIVLLATLRELEDSDATDRPRAVALRLRSAALPLLFALPLAACAFALLPRLTSPLWRTPGDTSEHSGLGDTMSPSGMQNLLLDDTPAFRVQFDKAVPTSRFLYWRGPVLSEFDGVTWRRDTVAALRGSSKLELRADGDEVTYEVAMEPSNAPWLLALDAPLEVAGDGVRDGDMTWSRRRVVDQLLRYRAKSALAYRLSPTLDPRDRRRALELPAGFNPRSVALATGWRQRLVTDDAIIAEALRWFHAEFTYELWVPDLGHDAVDDFLFNVKRGFCEYYAGAFVVLMRAAGIPARVVTGYQGGYYNETGAYLLVRQSDAHAWAEVWKPDKGWVRVDPTAAVAAIRVDAGNSAFAGAGTSWLQSAWIRAVRNQMDLANRLWNESIVQFNAMRQRDLLQSLGFRDADYTTLVWLLVGSTALLLLGVALWAGRLPAPVRDPLDIAFAALCAKLARGGVTRAPAEGPTAYAGRVGDAQARALLATYVQLRYATPQPDAASVSAFARAVRRWRAPRPRGRDSHPAATRTGS